MIWSMKYISELHVTLSISGACSVTACVLLPVTSGIEPKETLSLCSSCIDWFPVRAFSVVEQVLLCRLIQCSINHPH